MSPLDLTHLPFDIHTVIFTFLQPMDILAVGQTSKILRYTCSVLSVWKEALQRTMFTNSIFSPTFDRASELSDPMTLQELQHASTAPTRMLRLLEGRQQKKSYRNRQIRPLYEVVIPLYPSDSEGIETDIRKVFLVPGGRFVVATSDARLMVIDLERFFDSSGSDPGEYMVFRPFRPDVNQIQVGQAPHGRLRIVVSENTNVTSVYNFTVFEYDPSIHELSVLRTVLLQTVLRNRRIISCLSGNIFVFLSRTLPQIFVWDFVRDQFVTWEFERRRFKDITIASKKIILAHDSAVVIWDIPDHLFSHSIPVLSNQASSNAPIVRVTHITHLPSHALSTVTGTTLFPDLEYLPSYICGIDNWYTGSGLDRPLVFDIWEYSERTPFKDVAFWQQVCLPNYASDSETNGESAGQQRHTDFVGCYSLMDSSEMVEQRYRWSDGRIFMSWFYRGLLFSLVTSGPGSSPSLQRQPPIKSIPSSTDDPSEQMSPPSSVQHDKISTKAVNIANRSTDLSSKEFCFDPSYGRLCRPMSDGTSLLIQDFLPLPQSVSEKHYTRRRMLLDAVDLDWEWQESRMRPSRSNQETDLFEDVTDDERFYDRMKDDAYDFTSEPR
ncbi:hypothetical protein GALMADRAFT_161479 [Galerina marginata CBS 339.88]|uniref:F-box domain-containing protein n=1 Tax=Galerina marginata (strain CBS 339.88) TaxID=685588 RepID=A0A067SIX9_GALM3|nr:hypothetical protein GALMADRAFT_161479 [Galerina marginata CBS 339.88]